MAIAFDAAVESVRTATTDPYTWTHTPTGTPKAILVSAVHGASSTDHISSITYGGVGMVRLRRAVDTATEPGAAEIWGLFTGIPTGNQTVSADLTSATTDDIQFVSMSFTASGTVGCVNSGQIDENAANPLVTLTYEGLTCISVAALYGGGAAPGGTIQTGSERVFSEDLGNFYADVIRQSTPGSSDTTIGFSTLSTDDVAFVAVAIGETAAASTLSDNFDDASINAAKWTSGTVGAGSTNVETTVLTQTPGSSVANAEAYLVGLNFASKYDLTGGAFFVKLTTALNANAASENTFSVLLNDNYVLYFIISASPRTIQARKIVFGTDSQLATATYSAATHTWLKIRESGGTTYFDTSTDGSSWTNFTSATNPIPVTSVYPKLRAYASSVASPGTAVWDSFNVTTVATITKTHTTDANKRKALTRTHTTDAFKRIQTTKTHTTDANKRKVTVRTHTTDANKRLATLKTHTTDANKRTANILRTHTTDALKRKQFTRTHTTDALKRKASTKTHTTDANKKKAGVLKTHTTDALKRKQNTLPHTTDVNKRLVTIKTHTTDANKRKVTTTTHSTDANKRKATTKTYTTDALLRKATLRTHTTDTNKRKALTKVHSTDTNRRTAGITRTHTVDTLKQALHWTNNWDFSTYPTGVPTTSGTWIDGTASGSGSDTRYGWSAGAAGSRSAYFDPTEFHSSAASLNLSTTATGSYIEARNMGTNYWGSFGVRILPSQAYRIEFWMKTVYTSGDSNAGAYIDFIESNGAGAGVSHESSSTNVKTTTGWTKYTINFTTTATTAWGHPELRIYGHTGAGTLVMDAWFDDITIVPVYTKTHTTDGLKRKTTTKLHTTDVLKRKQFTLTHATDANKRKATLATHTTSANKRKLFSVTHTTDALKRKTNTLVHTTDANKRKLTLRTHSTDANKRRTTTVVHTTDANKRKTGVLKTHTTDALSRKQFTRTHATDAFKYKQFTNTHTTDTLKRTQNTRTHTSDAYLQYLNARYWVGGTGTWTDTAHWSTISGGSGGASVPTAAENVFLDGNSGTGTITLTNGALMRSLNCTGYTGTLSQPTSVVINIGDGTVGTNNVAIKLVSGMTFTGDNSSAIINFLYTGSIPQSVDWGGKTPRTVNFGSASGGGSWRLDSGVTMSGGVVTSLVSGKLDLNSQTMTLAGFNSSNANVRELVMGAAQITNNSSWTMTTTTNLTFDAGTSTITGVSGNSSFSSGGLTYYNLSLGASGGGSAWSGAFTCNNLTVTGTNSGRITLANDFTVNGTLTFASSSVPNLSLIQSSVRGVAHTITANGAVSVTTGYNFQDITAAGTSSPWDFSAANAGDLGGNTNIVFSTPATRYWRAVSGGSWNATSSWSATFGGATGASIPLAQDTAIFDSSSITSGSRTITVNQQVLPELDFSALTNSPTITMTITNGVFFVKGSIKYPSSCTVSGTTTINMSGRSTHVITTNGNTMTNSFTIDGPGGTYTLTDNFTSSSTSSFGVSNGTFDTDGFDLTAFGFTSNNSNVRTIDLSGSQVTLTGSAATIWGLNNVTNLTFVRPTLPIKFTYSGATGTRTIAHLNTGESSCPNMWISAGTDIIAFSTTRTRDLDFTGFTGSMNPSSGIGVWGDLTMGSGMTTTSSATTLNLYRTSGTTTITSHNVTFNFPISIDDTGGTTTVELADDFTLSSTRAFTLTNGIFDPNDHNISVGSFSSSNGNSRTINMGSGTWTLSGTGNVWSTATGTGLVHNADTSTIAITDTSASSKTISSHNNRIFNDVAITGGTGLIIFSNATTSTMRNLSVVTPPAFIRFNTPATYIFTGTVFPQGTSGNLITIDSNNAGVAATLSKTSGVIHTDYLSLQDSAATGGAAWYAGPNSVNVSGNSGWIFTNPVYTRPHTADALKRSSLLVSYTTDAYKRTGNSVIHSTDALKRAITTRTHSTSANKRVAGILRSHSTDALKRTNVTRVHSTDALKHNLTLKTHSTDALKRQISTRFHTTNANKRKVTIVVHSTDANKRKLTSISHTTDANKRKVNTVVHSTSANKRLTNLVRVHSTDTLKRTLNVLTHTTDALKRYLVTRVHTTDALLRRQIAKIHSTDANKRKATTRTHFTDALKRTQTVRVHSTDANKRKLIVVSHSTDANKRKVSTVVHTTSANKRKINIVTHSTDALKRTFVVKSHSTDALKRKVNVVQHATDTLKHIVLTRSHTTSVVSRKIRTVQHTTDALKRKPVLVTHTTDAFVRKGSSLAHTTDANKRKAGNTRVHTTDTLLQKIYTRSHTTDVFKHTLGIVTHSTDANKTKARTLVHTTDGLKRRATTKTHTTDALKRKATTRTHTTNVNKRKLTLKTHTTNSLKRKLTTKSHTTDAYKRKQFTRTHTTDANLRRPTQIFHTTDVLKRSGFTVSHGADAIKKHFHLVLHSTDTVLRTHYGVKHVLVDGIWHQGDVMVLQNDEWTVAKVNYLTGSGWHESQL